jgi:fermentation-respiration switch protein FrsA (DUF1100 family)
MLFERLMIYHPERHPRGNWLHGPDIEDCWLQAADGTPLHGWFCHAAQPSQAVVLYLHGNGGNLTTRRSLLEKLSQTPADVFALDYRGYGRSQGKPSEAGLYQDATAAWDFLTVTHQIAPSRIVLFGESLGGAVAIDLALRVPAAGLIVQSSFTSIPDMAALTLPLLPRRWICTQMRSLEKISGIRCPKLFIHSHADRLIPYRMGRQLFEAAPEPKQFLEIQDAAHHNMEALGGAVYREALWDFVNSCATGQVLLLRSPLHFWYN